MFFIYNDDVTIFLWGVSKSGVKTWSNRYRYLHTYICIDTNTHITCLFYSLKIGAFFLLDLKICIVDVTRNKYKRTLTTVDKYFISSCLLGSSNKLKYFFFYFQRECTKLTKRQCDPVEGDQQWVLDCMRKRVEVSLWIYYYRLHRRISRVLYIYTTTKPLTKAIKTRLSTFVARICQIYLKTIRSS